MIQLLSSPGFYHGSRVFSVYCAIAGLILLIYAVNAGLFIAPVDYQQGEAVRIMYVHVPSAMLSMLLYAQIGFCSLVFLIWRIKLVDVVAQVSASLGMSFTLLALISGAFWGKPMWGTWWIWDARLTSELVLLFLYLGYMSLRRSLPDSNLAAKGSAVLAIIGLIDLPIIHYSVNWWHTLHQGASISRFGKPLIDVGMLYPLVAMFIGLSMLCIALICVRVRFELLRRESDCQWVKNIRWCNYAE